MERSDTIAAVATPAGKGGIAVIRISGDRAEQILSAVFVPRKASFPLESHKMAYGEVRDGNAAIDECMAVLMRAPQSYTREDVVEIHVHGSDYVANAVLRAVVNQGARPAGNGEFTRRAFLNGRIDLSQAEAVMRQISACSEQSTRAAMRLLSGGAFSFISDKREELTDMLSHMTAALDFPEEYEEERLEDMLADRAEALSRSLLGACDERGAKLLDEGLEIAICGLPNVGKSSLFNALLMEERAIVTDIPGTTRDIVRGDASIGGVRVHLNDTAGIRDSLEPIEKIGIERAMGAIEKSDLLLVVLDGAGPLTREEHILLKQTENRPRIILQSKLDVPSAVRHEGALQFSARTGEGMREVRDAIAAFIGNPAENQLTMQRHIRLARMAAGSLDEATAALRSKEPLDLCAVHLTEALHILGEITGEDVDEQVLDRVFSQFCIGK